MYSEKYSLLWVSNNNLDGSPQLFYSWQAKCFIFILETCHIRYKDKGYNRSCEEQSFQENQHQMGDADLPSLVLGRTQPLVTEGI